MLRVPFNDLNAALNKAMLSLGLHGDRAALCARLFAETTRDGVYTHGLNRFPRFAEMVRNGSVDVNAEPERITTNPSLCIERWDAHRAPGNLAAHAAMTHTITLAKQHGLGGVALANTNHWMRGGTYGWLAAEAGVIGICWTNTLPNLPAWGATNPTLGNNPLIIAIPRPAGHVVVDMAMSQFSYGTLAAYTKRGEPLPVGGGFDTAGDLTKDSAEIEASQRPLPVGYWKGSGLALALDMMAAMLSGGLATHQFSTDPTRETGLSQIFLCIDPAAFATPAQLATIADSIIASVHDATPVSPTQPVRYPGEQTLHLREENLRLGVPVDPEIWRQITA